MQTHAFNKERYIKSTMNALQICTVLCFENPRLKRSENNVISRWACRRKGTELKGMFDFFNSAERSTMDCQQESLIILRNSIF